jgi:hypothetical protein
MSTIAESECPICMETIEINKNSVVTECGHHFHTNCLMKSISYNGFGCPYCRTVLADEVDNDMSDDDVSVDESDSSYELARNDMMRGFRFFWNNINGITHSRADLFEEREMEYEVFWMFSEPSRNINSSYDDMSDSYDDMSDSYDDMSDSYDGVSVSDDATSGSEGLYVRVRDDMSTNNTPINEPTNNTHPNPITTISLKLQEQGITYEQLVGIIVDNTFKNDNPLMNVVKGIIIDNIKSTQNDDLFAKKQIVTEYNIEKNHINKVSFVRQLYSC